LKDADPVVRRNALVALAAFGREPGAAAVFLEGLSDADANVRGQAADALTNLGPLGKEEIPALCACLQSRQASARLFAARALAKLGPDAEAAVAALAEVLAKDREVGVRIEAAEALGSLGPRAKGGIASLAGAVAERPSAPASGAGGHTHTPARTDGAAVFDTLINSTVWILATTSLSKAGSGWLVDQERRLVVTNHHVISGSAEVLVYFPAFRQKVLQGRELITEPMYYVTDSRRFGKEGFGIAGTLLANEPKLDLALIKLAKLPAGVRALPLSPQSALVGETVHSIGASGVNLATGEGALWRYTQGQVRQVYQTKIPYSGQSVFAFVCETQAPVNPGDSGGPVANGRGELVAVVSGYRADDRLVTYNIDVREVRSFLANYFASVNERGIEAAPQLAEAAKLVEPATPTPSSGLVEQLRKSAFSALSRIGPDAIPALRKALLDTDNEVRAGACEALGGMGPSARDTIADLMRLFTDAQIREKAVEAVANIGPSAVPELEYGLLSRSAEMRLGSVRALGRIGPPAKRAIPKLSPLSNDKSPDVRKAVRDAMLSIQR
jgi:HEAT repeat protein